jgi:meso-butanediol dehydrogenase / (S,S)-butanediol dehydrogenase / diacetyl reductase
MTDQLAGRLEGARVLVTGAGRGIGLATCRRLAAEGCAIAGLDIDGAVLAAEMLELAATGVTVVSAEANVADWDAVALAVATLAEQLGGLDGVVNVAGGGTYTGDVAQTAHADWNDVLATNLTGAFNVNRAAIPVLRASGGGSIVNVSSQYGIVGCMGSPGYCAAKAGVIGLTQAMALDHATENIRVNAVAPGPIRTRLLAAGISDTGLGQPEHDRTRGRLPMGRPGEAEEVAASIAYLLSSDASYVTGTVLSIDGGWTGS